MLQATVFVRRGSPTTAIAVTAGVAVALAMLLAKLLMAPSLLQMVH